MKIFLLAFAMDVPDMLMGTRVHPSTLSNPGCVESFTLMRNEVKEFMRQCERLISMALQTKELSPEECDIITYYAMELHDKTHPFCSQRDASPAGRSSLSPR